MIDHLKTAELLVERAEQLLAEAREEVRRADSKAFQGITMAGAAAAGWIAPISNGLWSPAKLGGSQVVLWWTGSMLWAMAALAFGAAIFPRLGAPAKGRIAYFGDVERLAGDPGALADALQRSLDDINSVVLAELGWTSKAAVRKYRLVRAGLVCFGAALVVLSLSLL